ncbi:hypothetical protein [Streptomyces clavuligerus]|uniref:Uncharacterized protein n=1 Tax=Streptomyces clavuligerus TaxID=1901 RepID=E2Q017_STRCL|nr:hypothetical protein [Streptomyces clavuligerus]ANW18867.1 hypothetical protein BB341_11820 [Streptomyces clavuligerus]AXU13440.1 hypothetical protein D1794_12235 [Streptomyces clavuligerus]EFG08436.1 Hypothetical protein SCLAV_3365 [Streptomyces clavuligerus]MBY6303400.1 hypothetical protein [Streptomyces clavuligerus]QCS06223.1 hypothetical protein CRV15_11665 [Streptomyces clavuligerus]
MPFPTPPGPGGGSAPAARYVCGAPVTLPLQLITLALEITPRLPGHPLEVATDLRCALERHTGGPHFDLVREPGRPDSGAVWTLWEEGSRPECVCLLPDCPVDNGEPGGANEACALYEGHPGVHSYHCADPETGGCHPYVYAYESGHAPM